MKTQPLSEKVKTWLRAHMNPPLGVVIALCVLPTVLIALFYILRFNRNAMDWTALYISRPIRGVLSMLSSVYPVALMEIFCTAAGVFVIYYIIRSIISCLHRRKKWQILRKRGLALLVAVCYVFAAWCWLWSSGYYATRFAEKNGLVRQSITAENLITVTQMFVDGANELSVELERDEDGSLIFNRREMFAESRNVYKNISEDFDSLKSTVYAPKPMYLYSWLMSITGYAGMYFALTGESMVNIQLHPAFMPQTVAHEHAHQLGVFAEDEANFISIAACVKSDYPLLKYSGYLVGSNYLLGALASVDFDEYSRLYSSLTDEIHFDRAQNSEMWARAATSNLGIDFVDNMLTSVMETANTTVNTVYDDYLKSHEQPSGLMSYGACVDLLTQYFSRPAD